ncbi:MAG: glycosyl transferase family 2 protein [Candidatus Gottesmanbacteria bacterium GW2011_GWA2_47_9]|uniref:Glycosyl transferase family 2 protein n=2 Tax=Microgenomates group TaxID=1794810 RepID=A0A0G0XTN6_9BACT|nr:MAG: glycosyl transferase family 2 protein [Candidatus Woesebacteria bacterium GW2011_GWA1_41_13b]KKU87503.1 MAG: glycosyl transferase family 2 protein [Candidatus Gottesmanbacteria bacterium GW2011_GWA2_47_9]
MKRISIVTPCYNEERNVEQVYNEVKAIFRNVRRYKYEHIFIDNASSDNTVALLKNLAKKDRNVKIIVNSRNFGWLRSPYHAMLSASGDAVILLVADLQDPPILINDFIRKWEEGFKIVIGIKTESEENALMFKIRKFYYKLLRMISEIDLNINFMGFGLYDRKVIEILKEMNDSYPYFRGIISEIGFEPAKIPYRQRTRKRGLATGSLYNLFDVAMLGIVSYSKIPLRMVTILGFVLSIANLFVAVIYFVYKLIFWQRFSLGIAPLVIGLFFFSSIQMFFLGIIGEYISVIHTRMLKRPLVIEKERINF